MHITFGSICYYAWGSDLTEPVVTQMLPAENGYVQAMKLLFCVNLLYTYRLTIAPTFNSLEAFVLGVKETNKDEDEEGNAVEESYELYWRVNFLRTFVVFMTFIIMLLVR